MRLRFAMTPLLALGLLFAACGDDDDTGSPDGPGDEDAAAYSFEDYPLEAPADAVTTASGLQYLDIVAGEGAAPTLAAATLVTVHYRGLFPDGTEFDTSYGGEPVQFALGGVIPGFGEGISTMRVGGQRVLYIPGELGYGAGGNPNAGIGPDQPLLFEVELVATQ